MTNLVSVDEARALIVTDLTDDQLTAVIERVETGITDRIGAPQDDATSIELTELLEGTNNANLYVQRWISSVTSVTEDGNVIDDDNYRVWPSEGRIERLAAGALWGVVISVVYKPRDQRSERKQAIIDLTRLQISRTAYASESIAGEYGYSAISWEAEALRILRRITFIPL